MYFSLFRFLFLFNYCVLTTLVSFLLCLVYFTTVWRPECGLKRLLPIRLSRFSLEQYMSYSCSVTNQFFVVRIVPIFLPKCRDILQQQGALKEVRVTLLVPIQSTEQPRLIYWLVWLSSLLPRRQFRLCLKSRLLNTVYHARHQRSVIQKQLFSSSDFLALSSLCLFCLGSPLFQLVMNSGQPFPQRFVFLLKNRSKLGFLPLIIRM